MSRFHSLALRKRPHAFEGIVTFFITLRVPRRRHQTVDHALRSLFGH